MGNRKKRYGWAKTRKIPHKGHPAYYERKFKGSDDILYWVFTHSKKVTLNDGTVVDTIDTGTNIDPTESKYKANGEQNNSYIVPRVYKGKRSALGKEETKYKMNHTLWEKFGDIVSNFLLEIVDFTSNSDKESKIKNKNKKNKIK